MRRLHELERVESRVLCALRWVDAVLGTPVERALDVDSEAQGLRWARNRSGLQVLQGWPALAAHGTAFTAAPAAPAPGSLNLALNVRDPLGIYLSRSVAIALPRDADPAHAGSPDSLFRAIDVVMYPAPIAAIPGNAAVLRATVVDQHGAALGGALLRVRRNGEVLARGLSDGRGEALLPVLGIPVTTFSDDDDAVVVSQLEVTLEAVFDPAQGTRSGAEDVATGRAATAPPVDPDALDAADGLPTASVVLSIAARRSAHRRLTLDIP